MAQRHGASRAEADRRFAARAEQLTSSLQHSISDSLRPDSFNAGSRWYLYRTEKEQAEVDRQIAHKTAEIHANTALAYSFDGHDPLSRSTHDYLARLDQFGDSLAHGHQVWENAYAAAHLARFLSTQVTALTEQSRALARRHAEQTIIWQGQERRRLYAEQRDVRVRFKQQSDQDIRIERIKQANTVSYPKLSMSATSVLVSGYGVSVPGSFDVLTLGVKRSVIIAGGVLGTLTLSQVAIFIGAIAYPSELGNGELTPEQRSRLFHAVGIPASALDLHDHRELQTIADKGGSVEAEYRLKPIAVAQGTAIIVTKTGGDIDSRVPVVNAVLDPLTSVYLAEIPGSPSRQIQFAADVTTPSSAPGATVLRVTEPQLQDIPAGVDLRIQDCIVCVPGMEPIYLSFNVPPMGTGVVTGTGQATAKDWWSAATQAQGAAIPSQIGNHHRGREFTSFEAFDKTLWSTLGEYRALGAPFDAVNKKRIEQGFAPYAPKNTWIGENREFELRYQERPEFWSDPFNLDKISIKTPNSAEGWVGVIPAVVPWPIPPASSWKPLVPPGSEHLGSTTSPITPTDPLIYPGTPAIPVLPQNETFPAVDEGEMGASIPGFPGDMELPSPDALFRDRRDDPGVASGVGQVTSGVLLGEAARGAGAPIPAKIADQLRGKEFANFHRFREAFWRAVAADVILRKQFAIDNLTRMRGGLSPFSISADQRGGRKTFELHHDIEIAMGGDVYGIDNISVVTPRRHIELHIERKNNDL
ncbi:S-type pyocin domain-containing protein [Rhodococcus sp. IEGM1300]